MPGRGGTTKMGAGGSDWGAGVPGWAPGDRTGAPGDRAGAPGPAATNKNSPMEMGERKLWLNTVRENLIMINRGLA